MEENKQAKKTITGIVVSNQMTGSIVIKTERRVAHPLYGKMMRRDSKCMADDPNNSCEIGDLVLVEECRPISKNKRWRLREILEKHA